MVGFVEKGGPIFIARNHAMKEVPHQYHCETWVSGVPSSTDGSHINADIVFL